LRPFVIHLADGREVRVNHREFIMTVPSGRTIVVVQPDDTLNIIDLLLATNLEIKPAGNRSGKRPKDRPRVQQIPPAASRSLALFDVAHSNLAPKGPRQCSPGQRPGKVRHT